MFGGQTKEERERESLKADVEKGRQGKGYREEICIFENILERPEVS